MENVKYEEIKTKGLELVNERKSFTVTGLSGRMGSAVTGVENLIESEGLSCRVYTVGRSVAAGGSLFGGITGLAGIASAIGIAAHNLATFNPDYEIGKHKIDNKLTVTYKK